MLVLATAGHVDHGKSALVAALTGSHPDRLKEEQIREMTIDLGFAFFNSPGGVEIGFIDVPGHIDFIENMLAGMGGIDGVILVVAADEGIMPQTREHLSIINILGVTQGIIAVTKIDLIEDPDWIELIENEIRLEIEGTSLENAPMIRVSAKTGIGINDVISQIEQFTKNTATTEIGQAPRLPIDRVFSLQGFGTVVTGTLVDGIFESGDEVELLPGRTRTRIRGLQSHNKKIQKAFPGNRTAVNLMNLDKEDVKRGDVFVKPGTFLETSRLDVSVRLLNTSGFSLAHDNDVKFFSGSSHRTARVRLLGDKKITGGGDGFLQLELDKPVCVKNGDKFILRKTSPSVTLGGGVILESHPRGRHKLMDPKTLENLKAIQSGSLQDILLSKTQTAVTASQLRKVVNRKEEEVSEAITRLKDNGEMLELCGQNGMPNLFISSVAHCAVTKKIVEAIEKLHNEFPTRKGFDFSEIEKKFKVVEPGLSIIISEMVDQQMLQTDGHFLWEEGRLVSLSPAQEKLKARLWSLIEENPYSPPTFQESQEILGQGMIKDMIKNGQLVQVSSSIVFRDIEFNRLVEYIDSLLVMGQPITITDLRDKFNTSRKYAVPFLEHMDRIKKTSRAGDERVKYQK